MYGRWKVWWPSSPTSLPPVHAPAPALASGLASPMTTNLPGQSDDGRLHLPFRLSHVRRDTTRPCLAVERRGRSMRAYMTQCIVP